MFCGNCGSPIKDGTRFCGNCGAAIEGEFENDPFEPPSPEKYAHTSANVFEQAIPYQPISEPVQAQVLADTSNQAPAQESKSKTGLIIALSVIGGVLVLALAAFLIWWFCFHSTNNATVLNGTSNNSGDGSTIVIQQIDNSAFPTVALYAHITDKDGQEYSDANNLEFTIEEFDGSNNSYPASLETVAKLGAGDAMNINIVMDQSGSMSSNSKMSNAQQAANAFIDEMNTASGTQAEVTAFSSTVSNYQPFTSDTTLLHSAVNSTRASGETALYDALYWAIQRTNSKSGERAVIAFTDGAENASHYASSDVVDLSKKTGIPVYLIGVGSDVETSILTSLASSCNGSYFSVNTSDLASDLQRIYSEIYADQQELFRIVYTSSYPDDLNAFRSVCVNMHQGNTQLATTQTQYMPDDGVTLAPTQGNNTEYVLPDSNSRYYSRSELENLSLWELYLARNEIYARHGRGFKNQDLVEYFNSRSWYKQLYTADQFEALSPYPLNDYDKKNAELMLEIEEERNSPYLTTAK